MEEGGRQADVCTSESPPQPGSEYFTSDEDCEPSESADSSEVENKDVEHTPPEATSPASAPSTANNVKQSQPHPPTCLHWVRMSALRIHDNPALSDAMKDEQYRFRAVFILDPWFLSKGNRIGINRCRFLLESLHDLDKNLRSYHSRLTVVLGQPTAALEELFVQYNVKKLTFQRDMEPYSKALEEGVTKLAQSCGVKVSSFSSHTLYDPASVLAANDNKPVVTQKAFYQLIPQLGALPPPFPSPDSFSQFPYSEDDIDLAKHRIPTMAELGFKSSSLYTNVWVGGETEALRRLPVYCQLRSQNTENTVDVLFDKSALSPYVRFGCLSVRYFLWKAKLLAKCNPTMDKVVKQLSQKLLDREFFFMVASQVPNYDITENNPICLQLPWEQDPAMLVLWQEGRTGYPWIDAAMRQLKKEGWIHHILRESVAAFLTSGDLWISWVEGKETFEELLLDYEPTVSCGLWMKSSCSAFVQGPVSYYCPISFGQKIDPKGQYIRTFCPELRNMPSEYIYSPWLAPIHVQKAVNCVIGTDYPSPIVDHSTAGALCCERVCSILKTLHRHVYSTTTANTTSITTTTPRTK